jgi:hypothetical protein
MIDDINSNSNINSNNDSKEGSTNNLVNIKAVKTCFKSNKNNNIINKPIIKEKNSSRLNTFGKKFFSPEQDRKNKKVILLPRLNLHSIQNQNNANNNNYPKINSFRESFREGININNCSSIKSINICFNENECDKNEIYEKDGNNDYVINYNIIYTITCMDNSKITCEYNYEKDSILIIMKNLKEIMNLDANDIVLLKNEFDKIIHGFIDKKKLLIFINKYYMILNRCKFLGNMCKKFDKIINEKNLKNNENNGKIAGIIEKIKDYQIKRNIINNINNNTKK